MRYCKLKLLSIAGLIGGTVSNILGGWDGYLTTLLLFMAVDYITGMLNAVIFKKSLKTKSGALASSTGWIGISKKAVTLLIVMLSARLDMIAGTHTIKDGAAIAYTINEAVSIIENAGLMGIPIPKPIFDIIDILRGQDDISSK